jgi:acetyl esterase/lipase
MQFIPAAVWRLTCSAALVLFGSGCSSFQTLDALVPRWGYARTTDVAYGDLSRQKLDVYVPKGLKKPAGVVVFFYGGDWRSGEKGNYRFVAQALASKGFVAVLPDYRLYPETTFPGFVEDGARAVRWTRDNAERYGGDPRRIYLMGHSAGAHVAAMLTLDPQYLANVGLDRGAIKATAALAGPYDFKPRAVDLAVFGAAGPELVLEPRTQPITFVDGRAPPMLLITGTDDKTVDPANATRLAGRIWQAGGNARVVCYRGLGHVGAVLSLAWPFRWRAPVLSETVAFFNERS